MLLKCVADMCLFLYVYSVSSGCLVLLTVCPVPMSYCCRSQLSAVTYVLGKAGNSVAIPAIVVEVLFFLTKGHLNTTCSI